jgi:hypothetical protein
VITLRRIRWYNGINTHRRDGKCIQDFGDLGIEERIILK